ncbi:MAG: hypothetical protein J6X18_07395 [Bacteroidales bacterium]|nr:hypothetical protein [Bacteroidales bacterium]
MIRKEDLNVGDVVCTYKAFASESRRDLCATTVKRIGKKYITVDYGKKFDKERLTDEFDTVLFLGTKEEAEAWFVEKKRRSEIIRRIGYGWDKLTSSELEEIYRKINEREE